MANKTLAVRMNCIYQVMAFLFLLVITNTVYAKPILDFQSWFTTKGTRVLFAHTPEPKFLTILLAFNAGSSHDDDDFGLATTTNALLNEGTKKYNEEEIAEKFAEVGAEYFNSTDRDMAVVGLKSLSEPALLDTALPVFISVISEPEFTYKSILRIKKQLLAAIHAEDELPLEVANKEFYKLIYGNEPYAHSPKGTKDTLAGINRLDVVNFYRKYYVAKNATLILVGNISANTAQEIAEKITSSLPSGKKAIPLPVSQTKAKTRAKNKNIAFPSEQTAILMGGLGIAKTDPDFYILTVGNYILGVAPLISELFQEVRNKHGLVYSVSSKFVTLQNPGPFIIAMQTTFSQTPQAIATTKEIVNRFLRRGPTSAQLAAAKKSILGSFPLLIANNAGITTALLTIGFYDLPLDYLDQFAKNINAVTLKQIHRAFNQHIKLDRLSVITAGKIQPI